MTAPRAALAILVPAFLRALLAALLLAAAATRAATAADTLRIGTEADDAPFETIGPDGKPSGFDIDLGNAICARAKLTCTWVNMDFDGLIPALDAHRIDAAMSQMSVTPEREKRVLFTTPVSRTDGVLVAMTGSGITDDSASMKGKTVGVQSGTTHETYAKSVLAKYADIRVYQTQLQAFQDLLAGRIDVTLCDQGAAYEWLKAHSGTFAFAGAPISDPAVFGTGTAIALRRGDEALKSRLERALVEIYGDGTYSRINAKYFPFSIAPHGVSVRP